MNKETYLDLKAIWKSYASNSKDITPADFIFYFALFGDQDNFTKSFTPLQNENKKRNNLTTHVFSFFYYVSIMKKYKVNHGMFASTVYEYLKTNDDGGRIETDIQTNLDAYPKLMLTDRTPNYFLM